MDTQQMFQELDRLYAQGKLDEAEEKMMGWMKEGLDSGNKSLCLMMCNEMEGLYRNTGRVAQAVDMADMALSLIAGMGLDGSIHHGTTLLNAATARRMAGDVEKALSQYREAEAIFKNLGKTDGYEMASLYNNISQIYQEQEEHEKALESLDKALELIKKMENSEAEVATTHVNRALSLMALGRLDEADEELKESLTFYASPEGVQSGHFGSALAAAGELAWRRGNYDQAIGLLEKALMVTQSRFGESDACAVIRQNLEMIKKEKEEKGITGDEGRTESTGGKQSTVRAASSRMRNSEMEIFWLLFMGRHFWNRKCRKKTWWQQEFAVFKCEATANSVTGHVCVNSNIF
ncbi:tetratricopeptide repeat protein [Clostridium sp. AF37-7]|uniref:tetratricopeptide repeat protein n=2 Tax=unclassified Clostridium TaxID=2614128 RepID=UPI0015F9B38F